MIRWYAGRTQAEPVDCEKAGWPHLDAKGRTQYENRHFDTEAEAWASTLANARAGVQIAGVNVREARKALRRASREAARRAELLARVEAAADAAERRRRIAAGFEAAAGAAQRAGDALCACGRELAVHSGLDCGPYHVEVVPRWNDGGESR